MIHRREFLWKGLGTAGAVVLSGRARGEDPKDDSDPAALIAKIGPTLSKIPISVANITAGLDLIRGLVATSLFSMGRTVCSSSIRGSQRGGRRSSRQPNGSAVSRSRRW